VCRYINLVDASSGLIHNGLGLGALVDTSGGSDDGFQVGLRVYLFAFTNA
jgi:hypothetical protein